MSSICERYVFYGHATFYYIMTLNIITFVVFSTFMMSYKMLHSLEIILTVTFWLLFVIFTLKT